MLTLLLSAIFRIRSGFRSRAALQVGILVLRPQLKVLKRSQRGRLHLKSTDRLLCVGLPRLWSELETDLAERAKSHATKIVYQEFLDRWVRPAWGELNIRAVGTTAVERWLGQLM